jgi:hypothetical protein
MPVGCMMRVAAVHWISTMMMIIRALLMAAVVMVPCGPTAADNLDEARTAWTPEVQPTSCGSWAPAQQTQPARAVLLKAWVIGFLSGINLASDKPDALMGTDYHGAMAWLDNYCKANPLSTITEASLKLIDQLRANAAKR